MVSVVTILLVILDFNLEGTGVIDIIVKKFIIAGSLGFLTTLSYLINDQITEDAFYNLVDSNLGGENWGRGF